MQQQPNPGDQRLRGVSRQRHYASPPECREHDGAPTWITRGDTFVVAVTEARTGTVLTRSHNPNEYAVVLGPGVAVEVSAADTTLASHGDALLIVPPGASTLRALAPGLVARIFSAHARDLATAAGNAHTYGDVAPPLAQGPAPKAGYGLREYRLADHFDPAGPVIQPRIFRTDDLMINAFGPFRVPRSTDQLRPHWHDDFEQASVAMRGTWMHHVRTPWGHDLAHWREDEHLEMHSPSVAVFPATIIHASRNLTPDAWLLDVFSPPREDFLQSGIVINGDEYPAPARDGAADTRDVPAAWRARQP